VDVEALQSALEPDVKGQDEYRPLHLSRTGNMSTSTYDRSAAGPMAVGVASGKGIFMGDALVFKQSSPLKLDDSSSLDTTSMGSRGSGGAGAADGASAAAVDVGGAETALAAGTVSQVVAAVVATDAPEPAAAPLV
jgi:hypothetical protein